MKIYVVPTHHWDPYWVFTPDVSEKMGVRNLRKVLDILKENPEFKYVESQSYLWELFQKYHPEKIEEFKQRVQEGKIILACGGYINPDFNLPSGESLIRQLSFGKRVWQEEFAASPEVAWIQDSFGQPASLPQIFSKMGLNFHTAKRGAKKDLPAVFIWQGTDGSKIFFDRQPLGHHGIVFMPSLLPAFSTIPNRVKPWGELEKILNFPPLFLKLALISLYLPDFNLWTATKGSFWRFKSALNYLKKFYPEGKVFIPHGFGFDGALPQNYIAKLAKFYSRISKDEMLIASPLEFLADIRQEKSLLTVKGELNGPNRKSGEGYGALPGTYSARIDVKQRARTMERLLYLAELLETIKYLQGGSYRDFTEIWKLKFLNDFHDGICGSSSDDNYLLLKKMAESLISQCKSIIAENLKEISPSKAVFNPLPWPRKDLLEIDGKTELVEAGPLGFSPITTSKPKGIMGLGDQVLFTPFYKVSWLNNSLEIYQLIPQGADKKVGPKITGEKFARFRLQQENGDTYFWDISQNPKDWLWDEIQSVKITECGKVRAILEIKSGFPGLAITQKIKFYTHTPRVDFETELENHKKNIRLQIHMPFGAVKEVIREIPAGFLKEGESAGQAKWQDVFGERFSYYDNIKCAQNWIYLPGVAVFNDGLPEHEFTQEGLFITLLRCVGRVGTKGKGFFKRFQPKNVPWKAGSPHPIPLAQLPGNHKFKYAFSPGERGDVVRQCYEFLFPVQFCQGNGSLASLFSISDKNVIPLAVKKAERGKGVVVRLLETEGREKEIEINLGNQFQKAYLADLLEKKVSDLAIENNTVKFRLKPQEIITLILEK